MKFLVNDWLRNDSNSLLIFNSSIDLIESYITADDLSDDMTKTVLPVIVLIAVEIIFGLIGNILILIVYYKWYKICSFRYFVLYMAFIDFISSLTTLPGEIISQTNWYNYPSNILCKAKSFFNVFTVWSTGLILFLLAYDRYRKICHPLLWQIPIKTSARLCITSIIFALVISSPTAVFWGIQSYDYIEGNNSIRVSICEKAESYAYKLIPLIYIICTFVTPMFLIMLITAVLNVCTSRKLLIRFRNRSSNTDTNRTSLENKNDGNLQCSLSRFDNEGSNIYVTLQRSFSFPAGSSTLKRKLLYHPASCYRQSGRQLERISENKNILMSSDMVTAKAEVLTKQISRQRRRKYYSESDVKNSHRTRMNGWQDWRMRNRRDARRRKTVIMLILSVVFIVTMSLYLGLVCIVANTEGVLRSLTKSQKVQFFFFWRLYFINSIINPLLYGFMDQRFRKGLVRLFCSTGFHFRKYDTSNIS